MSADARERPSRPIVGVGTIVFKGESVLLVQRAKPPRAGEWSIPGGAQALGETVREAALREVREETGLVVELLALVDVVDGIFPTGESAPLYHYTLIDFAARWTTGEPVAGDDAAAVRWVSLQDLDHLPIWDKTREIIKKASEICQIRDSHS